ncbi:MAG: hypothetical protein Q4D65_01050 [Peptostreptococcaceae bacterium]|nr:hypothetical protein [Peptostreptococcaceae bacterium]
MLWRPSIYINGEGTNKVIMNRGRMIAHVERDPKCDLKIVFSNKIRKHFYE